MDYVLIGFPTSAAKAYCVDQFMNCVKNQDFLEYDIVAIDTTLDTTRYSDKLKKKYDINTIQHEWDPSKQNVNQMLAEARNKIREHTLNNGFSHCLMLDSDMIIPASTIRQLLKHDKDVVGYPYQIFGDMKTGIPCVLKDGWIRPSPDSKARSFNVYTWDEIHDMTTLTQVYATGLGCCLLKKQVFDKVPFRASPLDWGEDLLFWNECNEKGIEYWIDPSVRPVHLSKPWDVKCVDHPVRYDVTLTKITPTMYSLDMTYEPIEKLIEK